MIKNQFLKELEFSESQKRFGPNPIIKDIKKIQYWLTLYEYRYPGSGTATAIDGDFGPATETSVKNYQRVIGKRATGVVTKTLFQIMTDALEFAFLSPSGHNRLRGKIKSIAFNHMAQFPREVNIDNQGNFGPWVKSYMDGLDGDIFWWCMGFVQTIIDQAISEFGLDYTDYFPHSNLCDHIGDFARSEGHLITNSQWKANPSLVKSGDIFLLRSSSSRKTWKHTGLIINHNDEVCQTIEGNTNEEGSSNGDGVYYKNRNYHNTKIDVFSLQYIVDQI